MSGRMVENACWVELQSENVCEKKDAPNVKPSFQVSETLFSSIWAPLPLLHMGLNPKLKTNSSCTLIHASCTLI